MNDISYHPGGELEFERTTVQAYIPPRRTLLYWLIFRRARGFWMTNDSDTRTIDFKLPMRTVGGKVIFNNCDLLTPPIKGLNYDNTTGS